MADCKLTAGIQAWEKRCSSKEMQLQKVEGIFVTLWQQQHQFQDVKYQIPICRMCVIYILLTLQESRGKKPQTNYTAGKIKPSSAD